LIIHGGLFPVGAAASVKMRAADGRPLASITPETLSSTRVPLGAPPAAASTGPAWRYSTTAKGIALAHVSRAQWGEGSLVAPSNLQPDDLVLFDPGPLGPMHEGIYLGGGEFIQAPHTGEVV
jgi:hypothetical protein